MEKYFKMLADWLNKINHEEKQDVVAILKKAQDNWNTNKNYNSVMVELVDLANTYDMLDMPEAKQFIRMIYKDWKPEDFDSFQSLLGVADSIMSALGDKEMAKPYYLAAGHRIFMYDGPYKEKNRTMANATELGDSGCVNFKDMEFARAVYTSAFKQLTGTYKDLDNLAESIGCQLKDPTMAREVYLVAFEKLKESKNTEVKSFNSLATGIASCAEDKDSAYRIIRYYLDNHAKEYKDFLGLVSTVSDSDYVTDSDLDVEVIVSCWNLAKTYKDYLRILQNFTWGDDYHGRHTKLLATAVISMFENKEQKDEFCEDFNGVGNAELDKLIAEIKNLSLEQIRAKYPPSKLKNPSAGAGQPAQKQKTYRDADDELRFDDPDDDDELSLDAPDDGAKQKAIAAIKEDSFAFENLENFHGDKDVVMVAVTEYAGNLEYATEKLRGDKEVVMAALAQSGSALEHATEKLRGDKAVVLAAVAEEGTALEYATEQLRGDKEVVMAAVAQSGLALAYATEKLRGDKEVVMAAVADEGSALEHATEKLRGDKEVVMKSLTGGSLFASYAFEYASEKLRDDKEVVTAGIAEAGHNLQFASPRWQDDDGVVMAAVQKHGCALEFASKRLKDDDVVVIAAVQQEGVALEFASQRLKDGSGIVQAAMAQDVNALKYANSRYWTNRELVLRYVTNVLENYGVEDLSELDSDDFETEFGFLDAKFVRDVWANRNNLATSTSSGKEKQQALKCPKCGNRHIYFYQGVPARDTYYANEVDPYDGSPGEEVDICPRMDRVDEVRAETFYLCHDCMSSWRTWDECKRACLPDAEDKPAANREVKETKVMPAPASPQQGADGDRILIYSTTLFLWDGQMTTQLAEFEGEWTGIVLPLPDGRILASPEGETLHLLDGQTGKALAVLEGHTESVSGVLPLPDGRLLSWSWDKTLRLWDGQTGKSLAVLEGHAEWINGALLLSDGRILSWSQGKTLRLWDGQTGKALAALEGHSEWVDGALQLPDGRLLSWSRDQTMRIWDEHTGKALAVLGRHTTCVYGALLLSDGRLLSWSDETLHLWDGQTGKALAVLEGHVDVVNGVLLLPNGRILSWSADRTLRLWDGQTGEELVVLEGHTDAVSGALPLSDGRILSWSADDGTLRLWDGQTGKALAVLEGHTSPVVGALLLPNGNILSWSSDESTLRLWDGQTGAALSEIKVWGVQGAVILHAAYKATEETTEMPASNTAPANADDFRAEYSQKIASGELDPAEVSYSSFLATKAKPKELNYRELYSRMISEGKIDPTETTFDEVQTVAKHFLGKDESEFKAAYGQGIGSGEIDPVSTTYDEIVRVAKFLNEAAKAIAVPPPTTEELKKLYAADIGAGKIDPVEVSFEKFVANYGK